ncbi:MAG: hypothetical protein ACREC0_14765 [Methylocella sp.]
MPFTGTNLHAASDPVGECPAELLGQAARSMFHLLTGTRPARMASPYSRDLRERMVRAVLSGQSRREVARLRDVSVSCGTKLMQRLDATGECRPRKFGFDKRYALAGHQDKVRALAAENV